MAAYRSPTEGLSGTEIRIHGIGNHDAYSALGSPLRPGGRFLGPKDIEPALVQPAVDVPLHHLWLLSWTRWSRSLNSFTWYLGLPFTLANTAGAMGSSGLGGKLTQTASTAIGLLLTIGAYFWSVNAVESVMWKLRFPSHMIGVPTPELLVLVVTVIWSVLLLRRCAGPRATQPEQSPLGRVLAFAHLIALWVAAFGVMTARPARHGSSCLLGEAPFCLASWSDWTVVLAWGTILLCVALGVAVALGDLLGGSSSNWAGVRAAPSLGAAVTLLAASVLLHAAGSVATLLVDWVTTYFRGYPPVSGRVAEAVPLFRAYDEPDLLFTGRDTLAAVWVPIMWVLLAGLLLRWVWSWLRRLLSRPAALPAAAERNAKRRHRLITETGSIRFTVVLLLLLTAMVVVAWALLSGLAHVQEVVAQGERPSTGLQILWRTTVVGMHALVVLLPFSLLSGDVRSTIAVGSDVVGYWPIAHHPLAAPPYRFETLRAALADLDLVPRPLVIVGHSQGSVLGFALVAELAKSKWSRRDVTLVTCGSPLSSLYSAYFPRHFPVGARTKVAESVQTWTNFWRETDPIATRLSPSGEGGAHDRPIDVELDDGSQRSGEPLLWVHGNYWLEAKQVAAVRAALATASTNAT